MTFAPDVPQVEGVRLTAEVDSLSKESKDFSNLTLTRTNEKSAEGNFSVALAKNKGSISSRVLKVEKGGKLTLSARATYDNEKVATLARVADLDNRSKTAALLSGAAVALSIQDVNIGNEPKSKALVFSPLAIIPFVKNLFSPLTPNRGNSKAVRVPLQPEKPKAYLEISIFADSLQTNLLTTKQLPISENSEYFWEKLQDSLTFDTDAFVVVSLRNESEKDVLFDELDLKVYGTEKAVIVQENHYEPFGMTLKGLDYVLNEKYKNQQLFGGKELTEDLGLEGYDFVNRGYDPQKGSFNQIDPLADKMRRYSPYVYCFDNPMRYVDNDGMMPEPYHFGFLSTKGVEIYQQAKNNGAGAIGAMFVLAQATLESGWGGKASVATNNFFGIMGGSSGYSTPHGTLKEFESVSAGVDGYFSKLESTWPGMLQNIKENNISAESINQGLNTGSVTSHK